MSTADNEYELVLSTPREVAQELVKQAFRGDLTTNVELLAEARYWYALVPATNPETINNRDLAAHWESVAPSQGERISIELKTCPEATRAVIKATEQATSAIKRAKEAQAELVRMIEVFGASVRV